MYRIIICTIILLHLYYVLAQINVPRRTLICTLRTTAIMITFGREKYNPLTTVLHLRGRPTLGVLLLLKHRLLKKKNA